MKPFEMLLAILSLHTTDLVNASPIAHTQNVTGDYKEATMRTHLTIRNSLNRTNISEAPFPNFRVVGEGPVPDSPPKPTAYPSAAIRDDNITSTITTSNTTEKPISYNASNDTSIDERGNVIADLFGFGVEDTIEEVMRPKPGKGMCFYRDIPRLDGLGLVSREYTIGIDMPYQYVPQLCGGLWDNLHHKGCSVDFSPHCKTWKNKHYSGMQWFFVTLNGCHTAVIPETFLKATGGKSGIIQDCVAAPPKSGAVSDFPHRSLEEK